MKLTPSQSRNIQIMRGLAIVAVVFIHSTPSGLTQVFCRPFLNFAVGLFLFFSGMLSNADDYHPKKRIIKVLIPYLLWSLAYTIMSNINHIANIPSDFIINTVTGQASAIMYYIFVYCEFTLIIPLINKLARSKFKYLGFLITPLEIVIIRLIPLITGQNVNTFIKTIMSISCLGWFTYFYLGYLLGNKIISVDLKSKTLIMLWIASIFLQISEGYIYYTIGESNCGTQLKLTSVLTGALFVLIAYNYVLNTENKNIPILKLLGDNSFGIYFSHIAVMNVIRFIPFFNEYVLYPISSVVFVFATLGCVLLGKKILGRFSKYLAL